MKTSPRLTRRGRRLAFSPRFAARKAPPTGIPMPSFTVQNFHLGRSITYTLTAKGYTYRLAGADPVETDAMTYPQVAALARRAYGLPPIGSASFGGITD